LNVPTDLRARPESQGGRTGATVPWVTILGQHSNPAVSYNGPARPHARLAVSPNRPRQTPSTAGRTRMRYRAAISFLATSSVVFRRPAYAAAAS